LGAAAREGVSVITRTPVTGLSLRGDAVVGVTLAGGATLPAAQVALATGRWTDGLARLAGVDVPLAPTCGLLAVTSPIADGVSRVVHVPGMNFRPDPSGGLVVQSGQTDATVTAETVPEASLPGCATLLRGLQRYLPAAAGARIVAARVGVRPMPADGLTLAGAVDGRPGLALAVTHSGVTLGPLLGELLAPELCGGLPHPLLEGFRPRRLVRLSRSLGPG
jgi:glycine/D-amino acid oxidase-like deaminating enzyme